MWGIIGILVVVAGIFALLYFGQGGTPGTTSQMDGAGGFLGGFGSFDKQSNSRSERDKQFYYDKERFKKKARKKTKRRVG